MNAAARSAAQRTAQSPEEAMLPGRSQFYRMNARAAGPAAMMNSRATGHTVTAASPPVVDHWRQRRAAAESSASSRNGDFDFWSPPPASAHSAIPVATHHRRPAAGLRTSVSVQSCSVPAAPILVEQQPVSAAAGFSAQQRRYKFHPNPRPRMGVSRMGAPVMTSTPSAATTSSCQSPPRNAPTAGVGCFAEEDEEPIYCEISGSPLKRSPRPTKPQPPIRPSLMPSSLMGNAASRKPQSPSRRQQKTSSPAPVRAAPALGLGRRAATQTDMRRGAVSECGVATTASARSAGRTAELRARQTQARALGDCHSDYGFNEDDAASVAGTESTADRSMAAASGVSSASCGSGVTLRRGLMWQQRDKMFSRWKERYFILTQDYLQCFKKAASRISEMGGFIFKVRLAEVEEIELLDKKGFLTISITLPREGKIFLRKPEGLREWHDAIKECVIKSKERRVVMKSTRDFWSKKQFTDSSSMEQWIVARQRVGQSETESCVSGNGLWSKSKSNVNLARRNPVTTYDYGFIDLPTALSPRLPRPDYMAKRPAIGSLHNCHYEDTLDALRASVSPVVANNNDWKQTHHMFTRDTSSTFSHDSGVDSMNTNYSCSVLSRQTPVPSDRNTNSALRDVESALARNLSLV